MFRCPQCKVKLTRQRGPAGVFWACASCKGRTASMGLLRKITSRETVKAIWLKARSEKQGAVRCPACEKLMVEVPVPGKAGEELIDVCKPCQFIWFDPLELDNLPPKEFEAPKAQLSDEARQQFAVLKSKLIAERARDELDRIQAPETAGELVRGFLGLPVEENSTPVWAEPLVTLVLAVAMTMFSVFAFFDLDAAISIFGFIPADWSRCGGLTALTAFFIHGNVIHLVGNVYFLLLLGDNVEDFLGHGKFLALILIATAAGALFHLFADLQATEPCIGASGGISGVMAFYALRFPKARLGFFYMWRWVRLPVFVYFLLWLVMQFVELLLQSDGLSSVSAPAHLGGASVGFLFWLLTRND